MSKNTDGYSQAFGFSSVDFYDEQPIGSTSYFGLTKREYFAAMAMQGLISMQSENWHSSAQDVAAEAVEHADALIAALNGEGQADA